MGVLNVPIDVVLERPQWKETIRALLHSILFHRLYGTVKPQVFDVNDVSFPGVSEPEIESLVNIKTEAFWKAIDDMPGGSSVLKNGQIHVILSEKKPKKQWFSISVGEEEVPWEQWVLNIQILPQASGRQQTGYSTSQPTFRRTTVPSLPSPTPLNGVLMQILTHVSSTQGREAVPLIVTSNSISPFPLRIEIRAGERREG